MGNMMMKRDMEVALLRRSDVNMKSSYTGRVDMKLRLESATNAHTATWDKVEDLVTTRSVS